MKTVHALRLLVLIIVLFGASCAKTEKIVIMHFNDTHSYMLPYINANKESLGGAARQVTIVNTYRVKFPDMLLVQAGDTLSGTLFSSIYKGTMNIELMNKMKFDMMTIGNHEFDYGLSNILALRATAQFPMMSANIFDKKTGERIFLPYLIKNIHGVKIVFVGLTTSNAGAINQDVIQSINIIPEAETLKGLLSTLELMKTNDLLICITHSGFTQDMELAAAVPGIDVIIGGHSHTPIFTPVYISNTMILQAGYYGLYAGLLTLNVADGKIASSEYELITIDSNIVEDKDTISYISNKNAAFKAMMAEKVCDSDIYFEQQGIRENQLPLGNFIADIIWQSTPGADMAIVNAGSIRYYLPDGAVTLGDITAVSPFDNELCIVKLQGKYIKEIMLAGVKNRGEGAFLYYSKGVKIVADKAKTPVVTFKGKPIDDKKIYKVAVSDFMSKGGDNYVQFTKGVDIIHTGLNFRDLIISYLKKLKKITVKSMDMTKRVILPAI
ncbi:MAG: bifunctional metallophosphatase/5'-nucleotidase [Brevinematales bacterium]|nr:bifunctional metallophosphatase/5'-nucleotidase [Brevinematales bacterium]